MRTIFYSVGGRKFAFAVFCVLLAAVLLACKLMGEANYTMIVLGCVSAYIVGNVAQDVFSSTTTLNRKGIKDEVSDKSSQSIE